MNHSWTASTISPGIFHAPIKMVSPQSRWCHCIIDLSTPATLERDFHAWLNGDECILRQTTPCCVFASSSNTINIPSHKYYCLPKTWGDENNPYSVSSASTNSQCTVTSPPIKQKPRSRRKVTNPADKGRGTNLYGRPYCPGRPLCMEERHRIITLFQAGMKVNAISKELCISHGCVSKIITRYRETGVGARFVVQFYGGCFSFLFHLHIPSIAESGEERTKQQIKVLPNKLFLKQRDISQCAVLNSIELHDCMFIPIFN